MQPWSSLIFAEALVLICNVTALAKSIKMTFVDNSVEEDYTLDLISKSEDSFLYREIKAPFTRYRFQMKTV